MQMIVLTFCKSVYRHYTLMVPWIDSDDLGVLLLSDASCDSVDLLFGSNQEPSNEVGNALKKRKNKALCVR